MGEKNFVFFSRDMMKQGEGQLSKNWGILFSLLKFLFFVLLFLLSWPSGFCAVSDDFLDFPCPPAWGPRAALGPYQRSDTLIFFEEATFGSPGQAWPALGPPGLP